jgi:hypothetical protein
MMSAMNLAWFIYALLLFLGAKQSTTVEEI